jgi:hypothetical protein
MLLFYYYIVTFFDYYLLLSAISQLIENNSALLADELLNLTEAKYPNKDVKLTLLSLEKNIKSDVVGIGVELPISHVKVVVSVPSSKVVELFIPVIKPILVKLLLVSKPAVLVTLE